ncbi:hypothetical protein [Mesorhizobium sp. M0478]|uniref:hypothetical protein n=1 Tax=Mesorhizobium sp. M0478 TaxID=2956947 RepID=UPI00333BC053
MRILITNLSLSRNSGSEAVVELLADGLRGAGHQTMLLAPTLGDMADECVGAGIMSSIGLPRSSKGPMSFTPSI